MYWSNAETTATSLSLQNCRRHFYTISILVWCKCHCIYCTAYLECLVFQTDWLQDAPTARCTHRAIDSVRSKCMFSSPSCLNCFFVFIEASSALGVAGIATHVFTKQRFNRLHAVRSNVSLWPHDPRPSLHCNAPEMLISISVMYDFRQVLASLRRVRNEFIQLTNIPSTSRWDVALHVVTSLILT